MENKYKSEEIKYRECPINCINKLDKTFYCKLNKDVVCEVYGHYLALKQELNNVKLQKSRIEKMLELKLYNSNWDIK
jgi:ribonuclease BN (tRNA processing enzyme)